MGRKVLASNTLMTIQSDESTFTKESLHIPPLGTKIAAGTLTSETSAGAGATPASARWEIITGKPRVSLNIDNDNQEFPDIGSRRVEYEPGNLKVDGTLEMYLQKDDTRFPGAVMGLWDATNLTYTESTYYSKYNIWILEYPDAMDLTATSADTVVKLHNVTFGKDSTTIETGRGTMLSIPINVEYVEKFRNYTLPSLTLKASTTIADGTFSLTTQPSYPTNILVTIVNGDTSVWGTIKFDGTDADDDTIAETLDAFTVTQLTDTTTIQFKTVGALGVTLAGWTSTTGTSTITAVGGFGT